MEKNAWLIVAKSNLHVGNENVSNAGLIDKSIQRNVITKLPCINSSSLKGALNEYATVVGQLSSEDRIQLFGVDKNNKANTQKGNTIFFDANILALPRPKDDTLYELVYDENVLEMYVTHLANFGIEIDITVLKEKLQAINPNKPFRALAKGEFEEYCSDDELPIIARNCLENGESVNLWYEQMLPQETILGTILLSENNLLRDTIENQMIQIGANATIGFGYCKFVQL